MIWDTLSVQRQVCVKVLAVCTDLVSVIFGKFHVKGTCNSVEVMACPVLCVLFGHFRSNKKYLFCSRNGRI